MRTRSTDGVLLADKPAGLTSHDVVQIARRATGERRLGHTGTLDPFATGLLVLLVGRTTRLAPYVEGEPKEYEASIGFGVETDTDDATGRAQRVAPLPDAASVDRAIAQLTGALQQVPPAFSAKKVRGERAYTAARRGAVVALAASPVEVQRWTVLARGQDSLEARIVCSGGTYIRALARDLGRLCGSAAHLTALRRTRSGVFHVRDAVPVEELRAGAVPVQPAAQAVPSLPRVAVEGEVLARVIHGGALALALDAPRAALVDRDGALVAIADRDESGGFRPRLVLRDA